MRVSVVAADIPHPEAGGIASVLWAQVKWLVAAGHEVTVCGIFKSGDEWERVEETCAPLRNLGIEVSVVQLPWPPHPQGSRISFNRLVRALRPLPLPEVFPTSTVRAQVGTAVARLAPDVLLLGHYEGLAAGAHITDIPKMVILGDPYHQVVQLRWRYDTPVRNVPMYALRWWGSTRYYLGQRHPLREMLRGLDWRLANAAHDAAWFTEFAGTSCEHVPCVVEDRAGSEWKEQRRTARRGLRPRILMPSNPGATGNRFGLDLFVSDIVPVLDRELGPEGYEVHVTGKRSGAPATLTGLAATRSNIVLCGFVQDIDKEFREATMTLVPNPIKLGNRIRIASSFSFGCPAVAHTANLAGMPDLVDGENSLISQSGERLGLAITRLAVDPELRERLEEGCRKTYEKHYSPWVVCARIEQRLEAIATGKRQAER